MAQAQPDSTAKVVVDHGYHYKRIDKDTPLGQKMILINKDAGVATFAALSKRTHTFFTHWAPLPTFKD